MSGYHRIKCWSKNHYSIFILCQRTDHMPAQTLLKWRCCAVSIPLWLIIEMIQNYIDCLQPAWTKASLAAFRWRCRALRARRPDSVWSSLSQYFLCIINHSPLKSCYFNFIMTRLPIPRARWTISIKSKVTWYSSKLNHVRIHDACS